MRRQFWLRIAWRAGIGLLVLWLLISYAASYYATRPHPFPMPTTAGLFDTQVNSVQFKAQDGITISAWYLPHPSSTKAIILLNGIGGNRTNMVPRAKLYQQWGFHVLLPDLRATGESGGQQITFGWKERFDLLAAFNYLKEAGISEIGVHGLSLGAATIVYSLQEKPDYDFIILESCYDNIDNALNNRMDAYGFPRFLAMPLYWISEWRLGVSTAKLSPEDFVTQCKAPTLFIAGDSELKVKKVESETLFARCAAVDKELYFIKGGRHEDFMKRFEQEYVELVGKWVNAR